MSCYTEFESRFKTAISTWKFTSQTFRPFSVIPGILDYCLYFLPFIWTVFICLLKLNSYLVKNLQYSQLKFKSSWASSFSTLLTAISSLAVGTYLGSSSLSSSNFIFARFCLSRITTLNVMFVNSESFKPFSFAVLITSTY